MPRAHAASRSAATCARSARISRWRSSQIALAAHAARAPGLADGRRDRADAVRLLVSHRRLLEWVTAAQAQVSAPTRPRAASTGAWPARVAHRVAAVVVAGRGTRQRVRARRCPFVAAVAAVAGRRALGQPARRASPSDRRSPTRRRARAAARRAPHLALLRDLRDGRGPHAAARQLPGGPAAGRGPPHVAHQHRPVPAVHRQRARFRLDRHARRGRAARGDARDDGPARALPRPLLQLVRHAATCGRSSRSTSRRSTAATSPAT